jgi:WD40 repeat protein
MRRKEEPLKTIELKETTVRSIAFSPDGSHVAACSDDKLIRVFDLDTWKCET